MNPTDGSFGDPGVRITAVRVALPGNFLGSICDASYASTMHAIATKLGQLITPPCLKGTIQTDAMGQPMCSVIEHLDRQAGDKTDKASRTATRTTTPRPAGADGRRGELQRRQQLMVNDTAGPDPHSASSTINCSICLAGADRQRAAPSRRQPVPAASLFAKRSDRHEPPWVARIALLLLTADPPRTLIGSLGCSNVSGPAPGTSRRSDRGGRAGRALPARHHRHPVRGRPLAELGRLGCSVEAPLLAGHGGTLGDLRGRGGPTGSPRPRSARAAGGAHGRRARPPSAASRWGASWRCAWRASTRRASRRWS